VRLCRRLYKLKPIRYNLLDLLVLVLQQAKRERNVIPLPFALAAL
jgi:hypothetical protein